MVINNFMHQYGDTMIYTILMAVISYLGVVLKKFIDNCYNILVRKEVINTVCKAVEQLYGNSSSEDKFNKAMNIAIDMLKEKGVSIGDLELKMMIECSVNSLEKGENK